MSILRTQLETLANQRILVDLFREFRDDDPITGMVTTLSEDFVVLQEVNSYGEYDGIEIVRFEDVTRLLWEGRGMQALDRFIAEGATIFPDPPPLRLDTLSEVLSSVAEEYGYVGVWPESTSNNYYIGTITDLDQESLHLHTFGTKRELDRAQMVMSLESVTRIEADGKYERRLISLFEKD